MSESISSLMYVGLQGETRRMTLSHAIGTTETAKEEEKGKQVKNIPEITNLPEDQLHIKFIIYYILCLKCFKSIS